MPKLNSEIPEECFYEVSSQVITLSNCHFFLDLPLSLVVLLIIIISNKQNVDIQNAVNTKKNDEGGISLWGKFGYVIMFTVNHLGCFTEGNQK